MEYWKQAPLTAFSTGDWAEFIQTPGTIIVGALLGSAYFFYLFRKSLRPCRRLRDGDIMPYPRSDD